MPKLGNFSLKSLAMRPLYKSIIILSSVFLMSCNNKKEEREEIILETPNRTETQPVMVDTTSKSGLNEVYLTADDLMRFNTKEIKVRAGQKVKLTLEHTGIMEKKVMGHNFILLAPGTDINQFGQEAVKAVDNDYIPVNSKSVIAHTKMLGGGERVTIEFEAPPAGTYDFICSFPGHYAVMKGKFIVE